MLMTAKWTGELIQEDDMGSQGADAMEWEQLYAIQQAAMRGEYRSRQGGVPRIPGTCWECGDHGHIAPNCPNRKQGEYIYLCSNCREEGHKASMCQRPVQPRAQPKYVPPIPKEQTAMNWGNKAVVEKPDDENVSNVRLIQQYDDVWRVATRRKVYEREEDRHRVRGANRNAEPVEPAVETGTPSVTEPVPVPEVEQDQGLLFELPDVTEEVLEHLAELQGSAEKKIPEKSTLLVKSSLTAAARREIHYDIMQDIQKRLAEVTIGQLLKDSPKYRKQVLDAVKTRRRRRLPSTVTDVRYTEVEDWGAPEIDTEIDGCMITRVPVDGGSGC